MRDWNDSLFRVPSADTYLDERARGKAGDENEARIPKAGLGHPPSTAPRSPEVTTPPRISRLIAGRPRSKPRFGDVPRPPRLLRALSPMAAMTRHARKHVLVIEDSPIIRRLIEVCLRPINVDITLAPNGSDGLERAAVRPPDAVVLDIGLPGIDGWEVLSGLQRAHRTEHVPVLMLTGHGETFGEHEAERKGAAGFMTKPFLPDALRDAVTRLLAAA